MSYTPESAGFEPTGRDPHALPAELVLVGPDVCTSRALSAARKAGMSALTEGTYTCQFVGELAEPGQVCCSQLESGPGVIRRTTPELRCMKSKDIRTAAQDATSNGGDELALALEAP